MRPSFALSTLLALLSSLAPAAAARADDFSFGGLGANFVPRQETRVRMVSEDIDVRYQGAWYVEARYLFENPTDEAIELNMGFPESRCDGDGDCNVEIPFRGMLTWVRDAPVKLQRGGAWLGKKFPGLGNVWMYKATFAAHERVEIRHQYHINGTNSIDGTSEFGYVVRTGALWAGPIERATFRFLLPPEIRSLTPPSIGKPSRARWVVVDRQVWTEVKVDFDNWTPTEDLFIAFKDELGNAGSEPDWMSYESKWVPDAVPECALPPRDALDAAEGGSGAPTQEALAAQWAARGVDEVRACRQRLMASYGARFRDRRVNEFFYGPHGFVDRGPPHLAFEPNARFAVGAMRPEDQVTYDALVRAERVAQHVTAESAFDVTATPELVTGAVGDLVRFRVLPNCADTGCKLLLSGRVHAVGGGYGSGSRSWKPSEPPIELEAVVAPAEFDSWFGDKRWLRLDYGPHVHHTKLAVPVQPLPYEVVAEPRVETKYVDGTMPPLSVQRQGNHVSVVSWTGGRDTSRSATAETHALVVRSGQREIVYAEVSAKLGSPRDDHVGGVMVTLTYDSTARLPIDVVFVAQAMHDELEGPDPLSIERGHLDAPP